MIKKQNKALILHKKINELSDKIDAQEKLMYDYSIEGDVFEFKTRKHYHDKNIDKKEEKKEIDRLNKRKKYIEDKRSNVVQKISVYQRELLKLSKELSSLSKLKTIATRRQSLNEVRSNDRKRVGTKGFINQTFDIKTLNAINNGLPITIQKLSNLAELLETSPLSFIDPYNFSYFINNYPNLIYNNDKIYLDRTESISPTKHRNTVRIPIKELSIDADFNKELLCMRVHSTSNYQANTTIRWVLDNISDEYSLPLDDLKEDLLKIEEVIKKELLQNHENKFFMSATDRLSSFSLDNQIDKLKDNEFRNNRFELIKNFYNKHGLLLYYGNYNYWSHTANELLGELKEIKNINTFKLEKILIFYLSNDFNHFPEENNPEYNKISYINVDGGREPLKFFLNAPKKVLPKEVFINEIPLKIPEWIKDYTNKIKEGKND